MHALILNLIFGVIGVLVAVGIPAVGLWWHHRGEQERQVTEATQSAQARPSGTLVEHRAA